MGWTHDYRDVARRRTAPRERLSAQRVEGILHRHERNPTLGIPHILHRRARWFGARLRHTRG
ncbi:hypothetical protein DVA86_14155 [Streptomyces armeniacus]|uniref:Uncharacterized protein n=1 Tax=Streptomyces armeniacus TaxID=83291 RepID=A0A345XPR1_9ACTN|nr:hypothetical protein [Streptomyces armeniacus]AXK33627.1 hypothetical protein DVA86_14155 [Streptomyces armeniacus]